MRVMRKVSLTINGRNVEAEVEPRRNLADFLREDQFLTGTHIGCEHGVCGACTVLVDGSPVRSCITYAVACDGAEVATIEGLETDPVMASLRRAFSDHHALQCGYCTPGMLISARDIVLRLPQADAKRIRLELSGNLCRCTGYVGIVAAVRAVIADRREAAPVRARSRRGPIGAHPPSAMQVSSQVARRESSAMLVQSPHPTQSPSREQWTAVETGGVELLQSFVVPHPRDDTWRFFADLDAVTRCIPGARLIAPLREGRAEGEMHVKLGPMMSAFAGSVEIERDDETFRGAVRGAGRDSKSASNARSIIVYEVKALSETSSRVDISVKFLLTGALAQFGRSGLVKDVADHLTRVFARNLESRLSGAAAAQSGQQALDAAALARSAVWNRIVSFFRNFFRSK
jgi:aerobic carbon-monoxide dehydrogenase small subunit